MSLSAQRASQLIKRLRSIKPSTAQENVLETPLGKEKKEQAEKVFRAFDNADRKRVNIQDLPLMLRAMGLYVTEADAREITKIMEDEDYKGTIRLEDFTFHVVTFIVRRKYEPESIETLLDAFEIFDPENKGFLTRELFESIMTIGPNDIEKFDQVKNQLKEIHKKMEIKVSLSDEEIKDTVTEEEENQIKKPIQNANTETEKKIEEDAYKIEPLNEEEIGELMKAALDPKTNTINYALEYANICNASKLTMVAKELHQLGKKSYICRVVQGMKARIPLFKKIYEYIAGCIFVILS